MTEQSLDERAFSVLTLNIWNRADDWPARLKVIRNGLVRLSPDLVGLQEVVRLPGGGFDQAEEIAENLGYHVAYVEAGGHLGAPMGNAILSRWPILHFDSLKLPASPEDDRKVLFARVDAPFGKVPAFCTHLSYPLDAADTRARQVRAIADWVSELAPDRGFPAILMGDFNAERDSDEMRFLRGLSALGGKGTYFRDALLLAGRGGDLSTFSRDNPHAASWREPSRALDYILVRGIDERGRGDAVHAQICFNEPEGGVWASDHFGVHAVLLQGS